MKMAEEIDVFEEYRQKELAKQREQSEKSGGKRKEDPRFITFKAGHTYRMRLLHVPSDICREPFIHKYIHTYNNRETREYDWITCPTSEYIDDYKGFKKCPICEHNTLMYNENTPSSMALYKMFKRQFYGFVLVYVVNDPTCEANNSTVKIMKYYIDTRKFLKKEVLGIVEKERPQKAKDASVGTAQAAPAAPQADEEPLGKNAFALVNGYDLIMTVSLNVTSTGEYNEYAAKFARTPTTIYAAPEDIKKQVDALNFHSEYYTKSTSGQLQAFYNKWVCREDAGHDDAAAETHTSKEDASRPVKQADPVKPVKQESKEADVKPAAAAAPAKPAKPAEQELNLDDIDSVLEGLE
jgi:hypothetical protein